ncbi:hypothetical protein, partial [Bacillus sp. JJ722]|uniref:hypothetical protein n=1 Tax=Bacillus sp. JJ722 TaxID=3122973 RepID=UPI002FFEA224
GKNSKKIISELIKNYGPMKILVTTNNSEVVKRIISNNQAIGFSTSISSLHDPYIIKGDIIRIPLIVPFTIPRFFGCIFLKGKTITKPVLDFKIILKNEIHKSQCQ